MSKLKLTTEDRVDFLKGFHLMMGYTAGSGEPIDKATIKLFSGRDYDLYHWGEIRKLADFLMLKVTVDLVPMSPTDLFVLQLLKDNGVIQAMAALAEFEESGDEKDDQQ